MKLVIVESANKAKKIESFLGKGYKVSASCGHITELKKVDKEKGFSPTFVISKDKRKVVSSLKSLAKRATEVILASDKDREGEAIAWHLAKVLGLDTRKVKRIVFTEITKGAIERAIQNPKNIDLSMVEAQKTRSVLDMLIGYDLSPLVSRHFEVKGLSAGRVQSVVLRLIVEKERKIKDFNNSSYFKISGEFAEIPGIKAPLNRDFKKKDEAKVYMESKLMLADRFWIANKKLSQRKVQPPPPFETSTLQQVGSSYLKCSTKQIMNLAQNLYVKGLITYHRTDSTELSDVAHEAIAELVLEEFGDEYYRHKQYKTRSKDAQEAHEAIRPTYVSVARPEELLEEPKEMRLYTLIRNRTIASQMSPAVFDTVQLKIAFTGNDDNDFFKVKAESLVFDGFKAIYGSTGDESESEEESDSNGFYEEICSLEKDSDLSWESFVGEQKHSKSSARFTEATLTKELKRVKIGRPSTYASMVSKIQERKYVEKRNVAGRTVEITVMKVSRNGNEVSESTRETVVGAEKRKLVPTELGEMVSDYLLSHFSNIMDYDFTSKMEGRLDMVAKGTDKFLKVVRNYFEAYHPTVVVLKKSLKPSANNRRLVGTYKKTGEEIYAYKTKDGRPVIQIGKKGFISITEAQLESITEEEANALELYPKEIGKYCKRPVYWKKGKFGDYLQLDRSKVSRTIHPDAEDFDLENEVRELTSKVINIFAGDILILDGEYGPYIAHKKKNYKIPKEHLSQIDKLSKKICETIIKNRK